ncbi:sepiapterin reductase-like [Actinia tenebrosa]|uniref:Sepiapterin reductase n=1 Tax=Actinia tenebrosa TaxID=6105 RepID=A0A6P8H2H2_ACTTE|nr:sepiapterin reductase-like [Actinia tenebrosa]
MFAEGSSICCILTGASQGFGAAIAVDIAKQAVKTKNPMTFILTARSIEGLEKTKTAVEQIHSSAKVHCVSADLEDISTISSSLKIIFEKVNPPDFSTALLINNAAKLGDISKRIQDFEDPKELQDMFNLNVTSQFFLMSNFIKTFADVKRYVVNISSLFAIQEAAGFSLYCTSKAASEMAHKVMAAEEPDVRVLCYAPGPLDTDMNDKILATARNKEVKNLLKKENVLQPEQSSAQLINLLLEDKFKSGEHIDYFDCSKNCISSD